MLTIFNSLTRQKEIFQPIQAGKVSLYVCGVTVYDYCHLGHARTYTSFDVIVRYLRLSGYEVNYVRNITDVDDKIIKRANENNENINDVTTRNIQAMQEDFMALGLLPASHEPRATEYIPNMIALIQKIISNGYAYVAENGDVYFDVRHFQPYGCLSHHNIEQLESGARVEITEAKRDPLDFVLWKLAKPNEPCWDSPWGKGRPGWHIECSTMSMDLLGEVFDIHGGGKDLIFPHHENEQAQSMAATDNEFARVWMHTGFLQIEKEKMSKSLGNFVTIRDFLNEHDAELLRYLFVASHYRSPLIYAADAILQARQSLTRFYTCLRSLPKAPMSQNTAFEKRFMTAMDDDFNTPIALSVLFDLAHEIQRLRKTELTLAAEHGALLRHLAGVFCLLQADPETYFTSRTTLDSAYIDSLILAREQARADKNWAEADRIRQTLADLGIVLEDAPSGTTWRHEE